MYIGHLDDFLHYSSGSFDWLVIFLLLSDCCCNAHKGLL